MAEEKRQVSRRDFIKKGAILGAGAASIGALAACSNKASAADDVAWDEETDVVVAGSGAGLLAAIEAADAGAKVILLEKSAALGGSCAVNEAWMNGSGTKVQNAAGVTDDPETHWKDYQQVNAALLAGYTPHLELIEFVVKNSGAAVDRLEELGCEFELASDTVFYCTNPRAHINQPNAGAWVTALKPAAEKRGVDIRTETPITELVIDTNRQVIGVKAKTSSGKTISIKARKAVILGTGDTQNNERMKAKNFSAEAAAVPGIIKSNTGDGFIMAQAIGADSSQRVSTAVGPQNLFVGGGSQPTAWVTYKGAIYVAKDGKRFGDETALDFAMLQAKTPDQTSFLIWGNEVGSLTHRPQGDVKGIVPAFYAGTNMPIALINGVGPAYLEDYESGKSKALTVADTLDDLASKLGIDAAALKGTVEKWNAAVASGKDDEFGRNMVNPVVNIGPTAPIKQGPFYALTNETVRWICVEGPNLIVNTDMQVLDAVGEPIARLYAVGAGLVAGGDFPVNQCGNHMMFCNVSGITAGKKAAAEKALT